MSDTLTSLGITEMTALTESRLRPVLAQKRGPGLKKAVLTYLKKQSFQPSWHSIFYHPFYFIRRDLYKAIKMAVPAFSGNMLDFGCGRKPYETLFNVKRYTGVDMASDTGHNHQFSKVDVFYDGKTLPFKDNHFDSLFCSEVFEHVFNPDEIIPEIRRVMKRHSMAIITTPFCWNEHEVPYDYARYTSFGMRHLMEKHGFRVHSCEKSGHFVSVGFQLWALYFFETFKDKGMLGKILAQLFITPINLMGAVVSKILPKNKTLYFNNVIIAEKI